MIIGLGLGDSLGPKSHIADSLRVTMCHLAQLSVDIFESVDADEMWVCSVTGHATAMAKLKELAAQSPNEFVLMHLPSNAVVATINTPK